MKILLTAALSMALMFHSLGQSPSDGGFTNKAEAKNEIVKGIKEGKWMEYEILRITMYMEPEVLDTIGYSLIFYKNGKPLGLARFYGLDGIFYVETPYLNGLKNGIEKSYVNGKLHKESPYVDGVENGVEKEFYESGILKSESTIVNGELTGYVKQYYPNGKLQSITPYKHYIIMGKIINYDEKGNKIE
ncbi:MAG TPA: hypothetical protein VFF27_16140 [Bacteroidia bacterium]|jgi:antitoxin component YwqK of YwqJK toxin-antitoxin module|nr:hypothetical protein [Bacteroidia bacterium]